jgi:hypothetical protein
MILKQVLEDWGCGLSGTVAAQQAQGPEFKHQTKPNQTTAKDSNNLPNKTNPNQPTNQPKQQNPGYLKLTRRSWSNIA